MKNILKKTGRLKASVLAATLVVLGIVIATSLSVSLVSVKERQSSISSSKSNVAYQAADSGIEVFMQKKKSATDVSQMAGGNVSCEDDGRLKDIATGYEVFMYDKNGNKIGCKDTEGGSPVKISKVTSIKVIGKENSQKTSRSIKASVCDQKAFVGVTDFPANNIDDRIYDSLVYNNKLYIATGNDTPTPGNAKVYKYDGTNLTEIYSDPSVSIFYSIEVFNGKLYVAYGRAGKIVEIDGGGNGEFDASDTTTTRVNLGTINTFTDLKAFNGKIYAGYSCCNANRRIWSYDGGGGNFVQENNSPNTGSSVTLGVFGGNLYLGTNNRIYRYDSNIVQTGSTNMGPINGWSLDVMSFMEYDGKFFAATGNQGQSVGQMYSTSDGSSWSFFNNFGTGKDPGTPGLSVDPWGKLAAMGVYKNNLYVGAGYYRQPDNLLADCDASVAGVNPCKDGARLYKYDGTSWKMESNWTAEQNYKVSTLQEYKGKLFLGTEKNVGSTNILFKNPFCD